MPIETQSPPVATRPPFRVILSVRNGPVMLSEPLGELAARLLVAGALRGGDQAHMVENHRPRHRWGEAVFAASVHVETVIVRSACTCGQCEQIELPVRAAHVPPASPLPSPLLGSGFQPEEESGVPPSVSPESAAPFVALEHRIEARAAAEQALADRYREGCMSRLLSLVAGLAVGAALGRLLAWLVQRAMGGAE